MRIQIKGAVSLLGLMAGLAAGTAWAQSQPGSAGATAGSTPANTGATADATPANANDIVVTGLRHSLKTAEDIKRNAYGVVDAITSEDIGKFPDTNLAEAVQRIPGVTIDRNNNEGSTVTVRGFGPEFNVVTLDGRAMPGALTYATNSSTRSFDFAELSADAISGVAVYKTGRADVPSGGIGSTIDIQTARPLDLKHFTASFQVKGTDDTSWRNGTKISPEFSGLISDVFADGKIGVLLNGSYSQRDDNQEVAFVGGWLEDQIPTAQNGGTTPSNITDNQTTGTHNYAPQSMQWGIDTHHRTRVNGQAVLQFKPIDSLVLTADYTYALYKDHMQRSEYSAWFTYSCPSNGTACGNPTSGTISADGTLNNFNTTGADLAYDSFDDQIRNTLNSVGANLKWAANSHLDFEIDGHHSVSNSGGGAGGDNTFFIAGQDPALSTGRSFNGTGTTIPLVQYYYQSPYTSANMNTSTITPLFGEANNNTFRTAIDEVRARGKLRVESSWLKGIDFGFAYKDMATRAAAYNSGTLGAGYYDPANDGVLPASAYSKVSTCSLLNGVSGGGCSQLVPYLYTFNPFTAANAFNAAYGDALVVPTTATTDNRIDEKTLAGYLQANIATDIASHRFRAVIGGRFEHTRVTSTSLFTLPLGVVWQTPTEWYSTLNPNATFQTAHSSYSKFLPSVDLSLEAMRNVLLRLSYSKTLTRPNLDSMASSDSFSLTPKPGDNTVVAGNPDLQPYTSDNIDFSAEWYYKPDSYVSLGFYFKHVTNFITQGNYTGTAIGPNGVITDPSKGAIAQAATAKLAAAGIGSPTAAQLFAQMEADTGQTSFTGQAGDPAFTWIYEVPVNGNAENVSGLEAAVQHVFGQTGFGLQASAALPWESVHFNDLNIGNQFAVPGMSKSATVVGFYEKHGLQARLAYTWRGAHLSSLSQDQSPNEPQYVAAYGQLDASASWQFHPRAALFVDAVNLTSAAQRLYGRFTDQFLGYYSGAARITVGVRGKF